MVTAKAMHAYCLKERAFALRLGNFYLAGVWQREAARQAVRGAKEKQG